MDTLTLATLETCRPVTWLATRNATFLQVLAAGLTHSGWLIGPGPDPFGRVVARVSHSVPRERALGLRMTDTYGPLFGGSSPSASLQRSLASRLHQKLDVNGSPEYVLTWKQWDMPSGEPICALRASGHRTSGNACFGWPTASQRYYKDTAGMSETGTNSDGTVRSRLDQLPRAAQLTGPAPSGGPVETASSDEFRRGGWATASATDGERCGTGITPGMSGQSLTQHAKLAGYPTARTITGGAESGVRKQELGRTESGGGDLQATIEVFRLPNMTGWKLNPRFSLWLMGYPDAWASCGERAMQSSPKSPPSS
jgi:hypothetical protein